MTMTCSMCPAINQNRRVLHYVTFNIKRGSWRHEVSKINLQDRYVVFLTKIQSNRRVRGSLRIKVLGLNC